MAEVIFIEEFLFENWKESRNEKVFVLVIYDIIDNKRRQKLSKLLEGYGTRIQRSAFETMITKSKYNKLINILGKFASSEDSIRVYKIIGKGKVVSFGKAIDYSDDDVIVL